MDIKDAPRLYLFRPGMDVPEWLERVEFAGQSEGVPSVKFAAYGVAIRGGDCIRVAGTGSSSIIRIEGRGMSMRITGNSVVMYGSILSMLYEALAEMLRGRPFPQ